MSHALFQSYTIPQGAPVRVCDNKGFLHKHKLKHTQEFNDGDRMYASLKDMSFRVVDGQWLVDGQWPSPTIVVVSLAHLEASGFIVFATGRERWPYIVAGGHAE